VEEIAPEVHSLVPTRVKNRGCVADGLTDNRWMLDISERLDVEASFF
jgi:hypothetical protein